MLRLDLTGDCHLRLLEESDADELYAVIVAERAHLSRWMPWAAGQTRAGTLEFIRMTRRQLGDNQGLQVAVVCAGRIGGMVGFHAIDWESRSTSIGYWLAAGQEGRGTMTRAVGALVEHAFSVWRLHRVEIRAAPENLRSRAIPQRLGFSEEGTLRAAERVGDRYLDSVVYALLAPDQRGSPLP